MSLSVTEGMVGGGDSYVKACGLELWVPALDLSQADLATYTVIFDSRCFHFGGIKNISAVEDERLLHFGFERFQADRLKFLPFGDYK